MKFAILAVAAAALAIPAVAQSSELITSVTQEDLAAIAEEAGHEVVGYGEAGAVSVRASTPEGTVYYLSGTACQGDTCQGINLSSRFEANERVTLETINQANIRRAAVSVWLMDDNVLGISRYIILDGGMTDENIRINLDNFIAIVPSVIDMFYDDAEATAE